MKSPHESLVVTVLCICAVTIASGPLVGAVDLTPTTTNTAEPTGLASVDDQEGKLVASNITIPTEGYRLKKGVTGSGIYKIQFPPARFHIDSVTNTVMVTFAIDISVLGFTTQGVSAIDADSPRNFTLGTPDGKIEASKITNQTYPATTTLTVRSNGQSRSLATQNVTIVVGGDA